MNTDSLRASLDDVFERILTSLKRHFSSQEFISLYHKISPESYADGLHKSNSARALHSWIARWYLNQKYAEGRLDKIKKVPEKSINGNATKNTLWRNKKK